MARNIEIKAYASDFVAQASTAEGLSDTLVEIIEQEDTFFHVASGRLKLREFSEATTQTEAQLIFYRRTDQAGPKMSEYRISECSDPESLKTVLTLAYGVLSTVKKTRHLYLTGRTRIHFDRVDGLGEFIELEVVLKDSDNIKDGEDEAQTLMSQLNILPENLVESAYVDLLRNAS